MFVVYRISEDARKQHKIKPATYEERGKNFPQRISRRRLFQFLVHIYQLLEIHEKRKRIIVY